MPNWVAQAEPFSLGIIPKSALGSKETAGHRDQHVVIAQADLKEKVDATFYEAGNRASDTGAKLRLGVVWKFKIDPKNVGDRPESRWFAQDFDDSAWQDLSSGRAWEGQGINYSGYAWYRQRISIPESYRSAALRLTLANIHSDDVVYFNGFRVGGLRGEYKYKNLLLRIYIVPAQIVRSGTQNTIAIRLWGGRLGFEGEKSGLLAGPYTIEPVPFGLAAQDVGASSGEERPIENYDLSEAQRGHPFELVFRFSPKTLASEDSLFSYQLKDFYGRLLKGGSAPLKKGADGILRGVVSVDGEVARGIYLSGRFRATVLLKDAGTSKILSQYTIAADHLSFAVRDNLVLPNLADAYQTTSYGRLKLIDEIDAAAPYEKERHPYLESAFGNHAQDFMTPGVKADVTVSTILGRGAREAKWSWFAYRIGRGTLVPGHTYLVRISYPEDKPRFSPIELQTGQDYLDIGWKNGVASEDAYDNWPLSHAWQDYDVIVPLGTETTGTGGAGDGDAAHGFWIYFMDQRKPGYYFSYYQGGPAVSTIKLYEIDPKANAPRLNLPPPNLPHRLMTFDWERQPTAPAADIVAYAKLMGYSAVSPTILKWGLTNYASPAPGFTSAGVDAAHYWITSPSSQKKGFPLLPIPGQDRSVHEQYLDATRKGELEYLPRVEYGGSNVLPVSARAIDADGRPARANRFAVWCADLLNPSTFLDFKDYLDVLLRPYASANPQLKGILWRIRQDRMPISYARDDVERFAHETSVVFPSTADGSTPADAAQWANSSPIAPLYAAWWQKKRAEFHGRIAQLLKSYRSDMTLLYFNWDQDKFSLKRPDRLSAVFAGKIQASGGPLAYDEDEKERKTDSSVDYTSIMRTGSFSGSIPQIKRSSPWPDYAMVPSLYSNIPAVQILAPVPGLPYANMPDYLNYFRTMDGLAVSDIVSYDEIGARTINPKFEAAVVLPGGAPFSMAVELLAYFYGDVRTLTFTSYTYGRGFADAHRRFAQAFRALPAISGQAVPGPTEDVMTRIYPTSKNGTYLGIAYKGYKPRSLSIDVPGNWNSKMSLRNLVTDEKSPIEIIDHKLRIHLDAGAMELNAFQVE